jgi:hypothetical protein
MTNVRARAWGASESNYGISNHTALPRMINVRATASGGQFARAIKSWAFSELTMINVTAIASGATGPPDAPPGYSANFAVQLNEFSTASIRGSYFEGATAAIWAPAGTSAEIAHSMLDGETWGIGTFTCFSVCNQDLQGLDSDCELPVKD